MPDPEALSVADFFAFGNAAAEHSAQLRAQFPKAEADRKNTMPKPDAD